MLGKGGQDQNPEMKIKVAHFAGKLCRSLGKQAGQYLKLVVESMTQNLQHQHSKVRKQTLIGLKDVIPCKGAEPFLQGNLLA